MLGSYLVGFNPSGSPGPQNAKAEGVSQQPSVKKGARLWRDHPALLAEARNGFEREARQTLLFLVNEGEPLDIERLSLEAAKDALQELVASFRAGARISTERPVKACATVQRMEHADAKTRRDAGERPSMYEPIGELQP